ncbi:GNAT family N-acetyltransferase [Paraliomyxa miuraensis]|uniref:GNAT family N-acetyltransferase n=1 Tax=Paraliomyxa miuraensis TaxID=376150 RepID=UPI0022501436|nr:GNAT family N-acetyltransferase [Paraliomyxa miuraensis]
MGNAPPRIVTAAELPDPARLELLARRVFGDGDRPEGWFDRKLRRECVDLRLSPVAVHAGASLADPEGWLGYVLVGTPPSRPGAARTAGTGVRPDARGQGLGGRLLDAVAELASRAGLGRIELWSQAEVEPFYRRHRFERVMATVTALGFGRSPRPPQLHAPLPWRALEPGEHEVIAWLPEAWAGTEPDRRHGLSWSTSGGAVTTWLSREGLAWLAQRMVGFRAAALPELADALLDRLPAPAPVVLPQLPESAPSTRALWASGWQPAQRAVLLERRL